MEQAIIRVAPNISPNAGHYGHLLVSLVASWIATTLQGRLIVRIDWQVTTRGSLHADADEEDKRQRKVGFERILLMARLVGASEVIDEYGARHCLDGIQRPQMYRIFPNDEQSVPIIYEYTLDSLDEDALASFLKNTAYSFARTQPGVDPTLPLIMEHTHVSLSSLPREYLNTLKALCVATNQLPRRYLKAYCHMQMDKLLSVSHIVRGNDFHSNRIRFIHEEMIHKTWGLTLPSLIRVPTLTSNGRKVSASESDGITGLFPSKRNDLERLIRSVIKKEYLKYFVPVLDCEWFVNLLKSNNSVLDAPIWTSMELNPD